MRTVKQCLRVKDKSKLTTGEYCMMRDWVDKVARYEYDPAEYAYILGWWILGDINTPLSPKEANME